MDEKQQSIYNLVRGVGWLLVGAAQVIVSTTELVLGFDEKTKTDLIDSEEEDG